MCGIAAFLGQFPESLLHQMNALQAHRGPDDAGTYFSEAHGIGLAHRRLSIIDLSEGGHQPMWDDSGQIAIVYNGELYNFRQLRADLQAKGVSFRSQSDTEVLIYLYRDLGPSMLERLNGIFAFGIWDARDRSLFLARDQFGVKPLYWTQSKAGFVLASELKAISVWDGLDRSVDTEALQYYLTYLWCPAPLTPFQHVRKLEPGKAMIVRDGNIARHWRYYSLPYDQPIDSTSFGQARSQVRAALRTAVNRQMIADVPVGAFLSGGLDSSAVVAFARGESKERLQCFSIENDPDRLRLEGQPDDLPFAKRMALHLGVDLKVVPVDVAAISLLDDMVYHLDEPQGDAAALNVLSISRLAREAGIKVLLSGAGGDDIFSGYRRHMALSFERFWNWLPKPVLGTLVAGLSLLPTSKTAIRRAQKALSGATLGENERLSHYFHWIAPDLAARLVGREYCFNDDPLNRALSELPRKTAPLNKMLYLESRFFLPDHNLNYTDKMGMAAGVEIRVPLLDPDLVALAARLPVALKQRGSVGKWIFREAMRGIIPDALIDRPKAGFGAPVRHWLRHDLREKLDDTVSSGSKLEGYLDLASLSRLIQDDRAGKIDAAYPLLTALTIESWLRQFRC